MVQVTLIAAACLAVAVASKEKDPVSAASRAASLIQMGQGADASSSVNTDVSKRKWTSSESPGAVQKNTNTQSKQHAEVKATQAVKTGNMKEMKLQAAHSSQVNSSLIEKAHIQYTVVDDIKKYTEAETKHSVNASNKKESKLQASHVSHGKSSHEIEMPLREGVPVKSKVALAVISGLGLGCCGIDRCYMGATCLGITKGLTAGGLGIWALIDFIIVLVNMLQKSDSIDAFGFNAKFEPKSELDTAFWITVVLLVLKLLGGAVGPKASSTKGS